MCPSSVRHVGVRRQRLAAVLAIVFAVGIGLCAPAAAKAPPGRYTINQGDGVVTDTWTKLQWQRATSNSTMVWSDAKSYCKALTLKGSGWRLPQIRELRGLVDVKEKAPAVDTTAFPDTKSSNYWSGSPLQGNPSQSWYVGFADGYVYNHDVKTAFWVRCVRGG